MGTLIKGLILIFIVGLILDLTFINYSNLTSRENLAPFVSLISMILGIISLTFAYRSNYRK